MTSSSRIKGDLFKEFGAAVTVKKAVVMEELVEALQEETPVRTGYARSRWAIEGDSIVNDADYIDELNRGSSQQAPEFFIEKTLLSHEGVRPSGIIVRPK